MLVYSLLAVIASGSFSASLSPPGKICKLNVKTDLVPHYEPLLILQDNENTDEEEQLDIVRPKVEVVNGKKQGVVHVPEDKQLLIACTGDRNANQATQKQTAYADCSKGKLTIDGKPANEETLACTSGAAKSLLKDTKEECGNGDNKGTIFKLGFSLTDKKPEFFPMVDVCHNAEKMVSYYSAHQLYGASLDGAVKSSERRNFSPGPKTMGLFVEANPEYAYSQDGQKETLDDILGNGANEEYISKNVYLARGHLAPDADFIYHSGQLLTYYYINVAPQWQTFNAGNWLGIEKAVRKLATQENETILVWTGTYGILKLKDLKGKEKEIYLIYGKSDADRHIPVPEVYWKLVQHPEKKSCTVAIGHNNVFLTEPPTPICDTVSPHGWPELTILRKGYVYYCDYDSFKKTVTYVPQVECNDIFEFPN